MNLAEAQALLPWWADTDFLRLAEVAQHIRADPEDLLRVLHSESGLNPTSAARNGSGYPVAVGLNQITSVAAKAMGISEQERLAILGRPVSEQLTYVERYFLMLPWVRAGHVFTSAAQLYQANAAPSTLSRGASYDTVLYRQGDGLYEGNSLLDTDKKGTVTVGDLAHAIDRKANAPALQAALLRLRSIVGQGNGPLPGGGGGGQGNGPPPGGGGGGGDDGGDQPTSSFAFVLPLTLAVGPLLFNLLRRS